jgi:hypothetical protein
VGKTWKDDKVISRHKKGAREMTADMDLRTRTKPLTKKGKGGGKNRTKEIIDSYVDELEQEWEDEQYLLDIENL